MSAVPTGPMEPAGTVVQGRDPADLLIDQARLSELVGRPVRAVRLRHKPGLSTSAVLVDTEGTRPPGWIQVTYPGHVDKLRNALRRAGDRGQLIQVREVPAALAPGGLLLAHGEIDSDPRLQRGLDTVRGAHPSVHAALASGRLSVLRYNPQRRLILRREVAGAETLVLRVTAEKQRGTHRLVSGLAATGVPVVQPLATHGLHRTRRVTVWPWFGTSDLHQSPAHEAGPQALAAGRALAALHAVPGAQLRLEPVPEAGAELAVLAADLCQIDAGAGERMQRLVTAVTEAISAGVWEVGTVHGDFSADQVLVDGQAGGDSGLVLTDFDRIGTGPLAADLGMFAAAELLATSPQGAGAGAGAGASAAGGPSTTGGDPDSSTLPLTAALIQGYAAARGQQPQAPERAWVARALLTRVVEPFRAGEPDWVRLVHDRLDQVQDVLA